MVGDEIRDEQAGSDAHNASDSQAGRQAQDQCRSRALSARAHSPTIGPVGLLRLGAMLTAHQQQAPRTGGIRGAALCLRIDRHHTIADAADSARGRAGAPTGVHPAVTLATLAGWR
jgi:hypothetical protein